MISSWRFGESGFPNRNKGHWKAKKSRKEMAKHLKQPQAICLKVKRNVSFHLRMTFWAVWPQRARKTFWQVKYFYHVNFSNERQIPALERLDCFLQLRYFRSEIKFICAILVIWEENFKSLQGLLDTTKTRGMISLHCPQTKLLRFWRHLF